MRFRLALFLSTFFDDTSRVLIFPKSNKFRVSQSICLGPFQEVDLSDGFGPCISAI